MLNTVISGWVWGHILGFASMFTAVTYPLTVLAGLVKALWPVLLFDCIVLFAVYYYGETIAEFLESKIEELQNTKR